MASEGKQTQRNDRRRRADMFCVHCISAWLQGNHFFGPASDHCFGLWEGVGVLASFALFKIAGAKSMKSSDTEEMSTEDELWHPYSCPCPRRFVEHACRTDKCSTKSEYLLGVQGYGYEHIAAQKRLSAAQSSRQPAAILGVSVIAVVTN